MGQTTNDGGPAFPSGSYVDGWRQDGSAVYLARHEGMSLRDYFAGQALEGLVGQELSYERLAEVCYRQADAMLAARQINLQSVVDAQQISAGVPQ